MNRSFAAAIVLLSSLVVSACDSYAGKLSKDNYDKISAKMARTQVEALLGPGEVVPPEKGAPTGFMGDTGHGYGLIPITEVRWQDGKRKITVTFFGDEVAPSPGGGGGKRQEGL